MRPILIGGCQRSGTTFLGSLLGAAPGAITVPESFFRFAWARTIGRGGSPTKAWGHWIRHTSYQPWIGSGSLAETPPADDPRDLTEWAVRRYAEDRDMESPEFWVDHTPQNLQFARLNAEWFPEARFIHIVRDGRAVAASVMPLGWGPHTIQAAADYWTARVGQGLALETTDLARQTLRVSYESLLAEPEATLRSVCEFCEIEFSPAMLAGGKFDLPDRTRHQHALVGKPPEAKRATAWKSALSERQIEIFEAAAGPLLDLLGYELTYGPFARSASDRERFAMALTEWTQKKRNGLTLRRRRRNNRV